MRTTRRPGRTMGRARGAAGMIAVLALAAPISWARAQTPVGATMAAMPATRFLPAEAVAAAEWALDGGLATRPPIAVPVDGQFAHAGASIYNIFNGGLSVVVTNGAPYNSGNVIASP